MDFTAAVAAEVATRLLRGEGRRGAYTPGALFGPELAEALAVRSSGERDRLDETDPDETDPGEAADA